VKALFASLLCLILAASQSFALKGGPPYPAGVNLKGTYAGVMQGVFDPTNPRSSNTLGLFSLSIPTSGFATGTVVLFVAGRTFAGTISGIGDPNKASLRAVVQTTTQTTLITKSSAGNLTTTIATDHADGNLDAMVTRTVKAAITVAGTLLTGTALVTATQSSIDNSGTVVVTPSSLILLVDGFKQSNS